jgi:colanic acid/amylovoran biosynthesis glycosyltransferase
MSGGLLLVIPPVVRIVDGSYEVEADFVNNIRAYLENFKHVTFACPVSPDVHGNGILRSTPIDEIPDNDRLSYVRLPYTYREDRHLRHFLSTRTLLRFQISKAEFLIFSPHANYDWSTLAAELAIKMDRKYDMEADWDVESVMSLRMKEMSFGIRKLRRAVWERSFSRRFKNCLKHSAVALLQGQDVYNAYKDIAPNPRRVLNVQISKEDRLPSAKLIEKLARVRAGRPLVICYAGRIIDIKGPLDWLNAIHTAIKGGADLQATWFGDGPLMAEMRRGVERLSLGANVSLPGVVGREELRSNLWKTDIFLFCHKAAESPRCLCEALAAGCALLGYDRQYPRELVARHGGGEFAEIGDWSRLGQIVLSLDRNRQGLAALSEAAALSGALLDRDVAIQERIDLVKKYLSYTQPQRA